jgi:membrane protease YdiL (CAAX protease family)
MDINRKELLPATLLTFLMAFLELSGLPAALFVHVNFYDIEPMYFVLMVNFVIAGLACVLCKKFLLKKWRFGLSVSGIGSGLIRYGQPAAIVAVIIAAAYCIGLSPFNNSPTVWRIAIEGFIYYIGVGIIEELYLRGLLQNIIKYLFRNSKNAALYAVLAASAIFGLGHMFGATGQPLVTVVCKVIWAFAIGVYLGSV